MSQAQDEAPILCDNRKPTLLTKYNIPVNYLDFDYIKKCANGREMEKIYHVLLSGEEGHFPELLKAAEEKLTELVPKSKYLRKTVPVLTRRTMDAEEWNSLSNDLGDWVSDIAKSDKELSSVRSLPLSSTHDTDIRRSSRISADAPKKSSANRIGSTDYASWDRYDADAELLKQDLQERQVKEEATRANKSGVNRKPKKTVKIQEPVTSAEAVFQAKAEKDIGNEFFKAGEYESALEHYTRSIALHPTATVYNNRAITC